MRRLTIRGYACQFNRQFQPDGPSAMIVRPGAFRLSASIPVLLDHDYNRFVATGAMQLWQDTTGLAFELDATDPHFDFLVDQVETGKRAALSVCFPANRISSYRMVDGENVEVVARTDIEEISFLECGACPGAVAWTTVDGYDLAPPHMADERLRWRAGYQANILNSRGVGAARGIGPQLGCSPAAARLSSNRRQAPSPGPAVSMMPGHPSKPRLLDSVRALLAHPDWERCAANHRATTAIWAEAHRAIRQGVA